MPGRCSTRNFSDLIDIAQEPGTTNENFGLTEGSTFPKIKFVRQPNNPEYYCYDANNNYVGFGPEQWICTDAAYLHASRRFLFRIRSGFPESQRPLDDGSDQGGWPAARCGQTCARRISSAPTFGADKDTNDYGYLGPGPAAV